MLVELVAPGGGVGRRVAYVVPCAAFVCPGLSAQSSGMSGPMSMYRAAEFSGTFPAFSSLSRSRAVSRRWSGLIASNVGS